MENNSLGRELKQLGNLIKRNIDSNINRNKKEELTGMNRMIIHYLAHNLDKDIFQKDIEKEFSIRRSTATSILQLMESKDLINRVSVEHDMRLKKIILTEKSISFMKSIHCECDRIDELISKGLTKEEIDSFIKILRKISDNLK